MRALEGLLLLVKKILGCSTLLQFVFWFECRVIKHAGLDLKQFVEGIREGAAGSKALEIFGERMIEGDFRPGGFAEYQVKDLGMGVDVVEGAEDDDVVVLPGASLWKQLFTSMVANGQGKLGTQGVISIIQNINGMNQ